MHISGGLWVRGGAAGSTHVVRERGRLAGPRRGDEEGLPAEHVVHLRREEAREAGKDGRHAERDHAVHDALLERPLGVYPVGGDRVLLAVRAPGPVDVSHTLPGLECGTYPCVLSIPSKLGAWHMTNLRTNDR
jgi:hypothetical protein